MQDSSNSEAIATAFTQARTSGKGVMHYPGVRPETIAEAYYIQDLAISKWPEKVAGWKVGGIGPDQSASLGATKLAGPVFQNKIFKDDGQTKDMPVFDEGFAAVEAEIVILVGKDAPQDKTSYTLDEAAEYAGAFHIGIEVASSPFAQINEMGPLVTISDFGNNYGLILGDVLPDWASSKLEDWTIETLIEGKTVGKTSPADPMISFRFILENAARRGKPLQKGMMITTGAITGVHQAFSGQHSVIKCSKVADMAVRLSSYKYSQ